jgi:predicted benzoate:H+ symporter BenE
VGQYYVYILHHINICILASIMFTFVLHPIYVVFQSIFYCYLYVVVYIVLFSIYYCVCYKCVLYVYIVCYRASLVSLGPRHMNNINYISNVSENTTQIRMQYNLKSRGRILA